MLIQCEKCRTIFRLDEARLNKGGSKVRCSRCGSLFTAYPPAMGEEDVGKRSAVGPEVQKEDRGPDLILMGMEDRKDRKEGPTQAMGKDEAFEADLEHVYKTALVEPRSDLEKEEIVSPEEKKEEPQEEMIAIEKDLRPPIAGPDRKKPPKSGLRIVLLVVLLALLCGIAGAVYLKPSWIAPYLALLSPPEKQAPPDPGVRLLHFESVAGSFVDKEKGGQLFVIRGTVRSKYPHPRSHILLKGTILDNTGKAVDSKVSYAGNFFTDEELKKLPIEEILKAMQNRDGMARQNFNVRPEAAIPFMIVFQNLPDNMSEFTVEAVSSSPGA